jgi:hypothetical protein
MQNKAVKFLMICTMCLAIVVGLVLLVKYFFKQ